MKTANWMRAFSACFTLGISVSVNGQIATGVAQDTLRSEIQQAQHELKTKLSATSSPSARLQAVRESQLRLRSRTKELSARLQREPGPPIAYIQQIDIPEEATLAMEELFVQQAYMRNQQIWLANALRQTMPEQRQGVVNAWWQVSRSTLSALASSAEVVADESRTKPIPLPSLSLIPSGASEEVRKNVLERHKQVTRLVEAENARRARSAPAKIPATPGPAETSSNSRTINPQP